MSNIKDKKAGELLSYGADKSSAFSKLRFISAKNSRLVSALYLVTTYLPDNEPIKWKLRERALAVFSDLSFNLKQLSNQTNNKKISPLAEEGILIKIEEIVSLLEVAMTGGFVSQMNFSILKNEYQLFSKLIEKDLLGQGITRTVAVDRADAEKEFPALSDTTATYNKGHYIKKTTEDIRQTNQADKRQAVGRKVVGNKNEKQSKAIRKEKIVQTIKDKGWASIKDISKEISNCSSKTIQRELLDMVNTGILKKKGERRWSRYALVDQS
jgi:hypothetical protein